MTKCKTIDLTRPADLQFDEETASFQPSWKNTILMTAYGKERTLVLARDGRCLLLPKPLQKVLDQFASDNGIADYERQALYDWIGVHKGRGYIAGNNRLVPTHGTTNPAVVYYMAYYLYHTYEAGGRVIASFHGRKKRNFQVVIDTGYKTFARLLQAADDAAKLQLDILAWQMHSYGVKKVHKRQSVRFYDMCSTKRLMCQDLRKRWMLGFRPLTLDELHQLVPKLSIDELQAELARLQNLRIANPVKDTENCYSLTEDGDDFRQLLISLSIWGKQQMNDNEDKISPLVVEPEADAKLSELVKYSALLREYINYDE